MQKVLLKSGPLGPQDLKAKKGHAPRYLNCLPVYAAYHICTKLCIFSHIFKKCSKIRPLGPPKILKA